MTTTLEIEQRPLGRSGLTVPRIALGCGNFGGVGSAPELFGQGLSEDQAFELMDAAWALGIGYFDTADAYGGGRSELADRPLDRLARRPARVDDKDVQPDGQRRGQRPLARADRAPARVEPRRLGVDRVELYLAHDFDPYTPLGETIGAFEEAQAAGPDQDVRREQLRLVPARGGDERRLPAGDPERATRCSAGAEAVLRCAPSGGSPTRRSARSPAAG